VLRWDAARTVLPGALSESERDVVTRALRGFSNAEIATQRGTSPRTIANQMARVFRKLGVQSRHELHATVLRRRAP
jgi:DNA-binding CsgD family transcriptional regulator